MAPAEGERPPQVLTPLDQLAAGSDEWLDELRAAMRTPRGGRLGRFEVLEEIGHGGQGHVFRAL